MSYGSLPRALSALVLATAIGYTPTAIASHFRGGNVYVEVAPNSDVTVTIDTLWRKTAFTDLGSINIRNDSNASLANFATRVAVPSCGSGNLTGWTVEGSGSNQSCVNTSNDTYSIRRSMWRFRMSSSGTFPAPGGTYAANTFYKVYLTSCCRVGNIANAPEADWALTGRFKWETTRTSQTPKLDANITTSLFKTTSGVVPGDYSTNLGAIDPDGPLSYSLRTGATTPDFNPTSLIGASATQSYHPTNNTCRESNNGSPADPGATAPCGTNCPATCPCPTCTTNMYPNLTGCYGTMAGTNTTCSAVGLSTNPYVDSSWQMSVDSAGQVVIPGKTIRTMKDLTGYEQISAAGDYVYKLRVTDSTGAYSERDILLNIAKTANTPPNIPVFTGDVTGSLNHPMTINVSASDPDAANTVTLILSNIPSWMTFTRSGSNPATAVITGTPTLPAQAGAYTINVDARDNGTPQLTSSNALTINVQGVNDTPVLTFVPNQGIATNPDTGALLLSSGTTLIVNVSASDPNPQDSLTLSAFFGTEGSLPSGATFVQTGPGSGVFTWNITSAHEGVWSPGTAASGKAPLSLRVRDNGIPQLSATQVVSISIGPSANVSPALNIYNPGTTQPLATPLLGTESDRFRFDLVCGDDNPQNTLTLQVSGTTPLPAGATLTQTPTGFNNPVRYTFDWTVAAGQAGTRTLEFFCRDNGNPSLEERRSVTFNVSAPTSPPRIISIVPNQGDAAGGTLVQINGTALDGTTNVRFGPAGSMVAVPFVRVSDTLVTFQTTPGTAGTLANIEITTAFGSDLREFGFQYRANADTDGDGIVDCVESNSGLIAISGTDDSDHDNRPNLNDLDSDGDGISDAAESVIPSGSTAYRSFTCGGVEVRVADTDRDANPDFLDADSDNDGVFDSEEGQSDLDSDGTANYRDLDSDGDGFSDSVDNCREARNPTQADGDHDGQGDACDNDLDNDGLTNAQETAYGTDPNNPDTDADFLTDYDEVFVYFTNPNDSDTDNGGVVDGTEIQRGTDPRNAADDDNVAPVISISAPSTVEATGASGAIVNYTATANDNVDGARPVSCSRASGSVFPLGSTTVTCVASDSTGNTASQNFTVVVRDSIAPAVTVPANITAEATSAAGVAVTFSATANDTVSGSLAASCSPASGSIFAIGTTAVTCSATDGSGNTGSASFSITVRDTIAPVVTVPADITQEATGASGAAVTFSASANDTVGGSLATTCTPASGSTFALGTTSVTCSATDASGNTGSASFSVIVRDTTAPVVTVPANITAEATSAAGAAVTFAASANDTVGGSLAATCTPASGSTFGIGANNVTCSATDAAGNTGSASFSITIEDHTAPVIAGVPADITAEASYAGGTVVTYTSPSAADLVDGSLSVPCSPASGSIFPIGTTAVTCSVSDARGNASSASFNVTVRDTTAPEVAVSPDLVVEATGASGAAVSFTSSAYDLVDGAVATNCAPASGSTFAIGTTQVTCSASDAHGNSSSASFAITVRDTTAPALAGASDLGAEATSAAGAAVSFAAPAATDAVDGALVSTCAPASGSTFAIGTTLVTCSVSDAHGNSASTSFSVTVSDTTAPSIAVPFDVTVEAIAASGAPATYDVSASDLVDGVTSVSCAPVSGSTFPIGTTAVYCSSTDAHGNTGYADFDVVVFDGDEDGDGVLNTVDNCWHAANASQSDADGDGRGDACDDDDHDGVLDVVDNCPLVANSDQANNDGDATGDICDDDDDNDGVDDAADNCAMTANADQVNTDGDAEGDACDADDDNDGVLDTTDNCRIVVNANQADRDSDAIGDLCDDSDSDGVLDATDNCFTRANPDQFDRDGDGPGDVCDNCVVIANTNQADTDADGIGNVCDGQPTVASPPTQASQAIDTDATAPITVASPSGLVTVTFPPGSIPAGTVDPTFTMDQMSMPDFRIELGANGGTIITGWDMQLGPSSPFWLTPGTSAEITMVVGYTPALGTAVANHSIGITSREPGGNYLLIPNCEAVAPASNHLPDGRCSTAYVWYDQFNIPRRVYVSAPAIHFSEYFVVDYTPPFVYTPVAIDGVEATSGAGAAVTFDASAEDNLDGELEVTCTPASGSIFAVGSTVVSCAATDLDNNTTTETFQVTVVDRTAPVLSLHDVGGVEATSAAGAAVSFTQSAMDLVDGAITAACTPASGSTFAMGTTAVNCTATDAHGNASSGTFTVTVVDTTAPVVTVPANMTVEATGSSGKVVSFTTSAADIVGGARPTTCTPASGSTFAIGATTVTCSATDAHGNTGTASFTITVQDTTAPTVTVPANISTIANLATGRVVTFSATATDLVDGSVAVTCTPASGSTFAPGTTTVSCTATDARGNTSAARTFTVTVTFSWSALLSPVNADGTSVYKKRSTIPVKFDLTGASAGITTANVRLYYAQVTNGTVGEVNEAFSTSAADTGNQFRYTGGHYQFNLSTDAFSEGTWVLRVDFGDGVIHDTTIGIRR